MAKIDKEIGEHDPINGTKFTVFAPQQILNFQRHDWYVYGFFNQ
jgi:hypothetical protein